MNYSSYLILQADLAVKPKHFLRVLTFKNLSGHLAALKSKQGGEMCSNPFTAVGKHTFKNSKLIIFPPWGAERRRFLPPS